MVIDTKQSTVDFRLVFGITGDPVHCGHRQVIINSHQFMAERQLTVSQFDLIPSYAANLIADKSTATADYQQRKTMCELLATELKGHGYNIYVSDIEEKLFLKNKTKSYSRQTLKAIDHRHKLFVLSADHFSGSKPTFQLWHQWQKLIEENGLLIHPRPEYPLNYAFIDSLKQYNPNIHIVTTGKQIHISSSDLRKQLASNPQTAQPYIPPNIFSYILQQKLYNTEAT